MAYINVARVDDLLKQPPVDVLVTHQGPSSLQGEEKGSETLQFLLEYRKARVWFHGHSTPNKEMVWAGPAGETLVVPLEDVAFPGRDPHTDEPGEDGWAWVHVGPTVEVCRTRPDFWRWYRRHKWQAVDGWGLVCPDLEKWVR
jgi:hypothetical protein